MKESRDGANLCCVEDPRPLWFSPRLNLLWYVFSVIVVHEFAACLMFLLTPVAAQDNFKSPELAEGKAAAPAPSPAFQTVKPVCFGRKNQGLQLVVSALWLKTVWKKMPEFTSKTLFSRVSDAILFFTTVSLMKTIPKTQKRKCQTEFRVSCWTVQSCLRSTVHS